MQGNRRLKLSKLIALGVVVLVLGCDAPVQMRQKRAQLDGLLLTNATRVNVERQLGITFTYTSVTNTHWTNALQNFLKYSDPIVRNFEKSVIFGHASNNEIQIYTFLDEQDRLVGFDVRSQ